ncbi:hypothetical protein SAMN05421783_101197 [Thiocapsa roseopersicina]|uniref:Uncharacterized protein n=1 Tax=Thiocapsa roseopersicina TaxID=1058 RepID=A0A1H2QAV9_THIRO|nr:hypothetical protein SAMN05421783_101197 [Thiocapsa roseopersicina]
MSSGRLSVWLRGLALLRYPEVLRFLGDRRLDLACLDRIRQPHPGFKLADNVCSASFAPQPLQPRSCVCPRRTQ